MWETDRQFCFLSPQISSIWFLESVFRQLCLTRWTFHQLIHQAQPSLTLQGCGGSLADRGDAEEGGLACVGLPSSGQCGTLQIRLHMRTRSPISVHCSKTHPAHCLEKALWQLTARNHGVRQWWPVCACQMRQMQPNGGDWGSTQLRSVLKIHDEQNVASH